ncbi:MAG: ATP-binding cassette domain-containing protein [Sedimentisphaerales bacterium]|nr:ATP-binding cassette domain-containing protein [Sedimentisphaerales bacterium]
MSVIEIERLTKRYGRRLGIDNLTLRVDAGELFGFLGPNGSGKTTAIRVLMGLLRADAGGARVAGYDCWKAGHRVKAEVGYLPGDLRLYPWLTCTAALRIAGRARRRDLRRPGLELAELFDLEPTVRAGQMSRGMRQKLGLILALAHRPRVLILDEPAAALDPLVQETLFGVLRERAQAGDTVFFSSHTLSEVERLCDRVAILRAGRLMADETLAALRSRAGRTVTILWRRDSDPGTIAPPPVLRVHQREGHRWRATLTGPATAFARWSVGQPIEDLSIGQADLNRLFQQYYSHPERNP